MFGLSANSQRVNHDPCLGVRHTQLLHLGLVPFTGADADLLCLTDLNRTLQRDEPAITLRIIRSLQRVRLAMQLEADLMRVALL